MRQLLPPSTLRIFLLAVAVVSLSCSKKSASSFDALESNKGIGECTAINSASPSGAAVRVSAESLQAKTFGVSVSGSCKVDFELNGTKISTTTDSTFIQIVSTSLRAGSNTLVATVYDTIGHSFTQSWTVVKNALPACGTLTPNSTGNQITYGSALALTAQYTDTDGDTVVGTWKLNGASASSLFTGITATSTAVQSVFQPTVSQVGVNTVTVEMYDGYDTSSCSWNVQVNDSNSAQITSCTPNTTTMGVPDVITEEGATNRRTYSATANGTGISYQWKVKTPGAGSFTNLSSKTTSAIQLDQTDLPAVSGIYTLQLLVTDAYGNTAQCPNPIFIKSNAKPVINGTQKATYLSTDMTGTSLKFNIEGTSANGQSLLMTAGTSATDGNSDTLTYIWTVGGVEYPSYLPSGAVTSTFAPGGSAITTGNHVVKLTVSDGYESTYKTWNMQLNYFNNECNFLNSGSICTFVGASGVGHNRNPSDLNDRSKIRMFPTKIITHNIGGTWNATTKSYSGGTDNLIIADANNHVVWYYNRTAGDLTYFGRTLPANKLTALLGNGAAGSAGISYGSFTNPPSAPLYNPTEFPTKINDPRGLALQDNNHQADPVLFVAARGSNRVYAVSSQGSTLVAGNGATDTGSNITGSNVRCDEAWGLAYKHSSNTLYVSCYASGTASRQRIWAIDVTNINNSTPSATATNIFQGTAGASTDAAVATAATRLPRGMAIDEATGDLFWIEHCASNAGGFLRIYSPSGFSRGGVTVTAGQVGHAGSKAGNCTAAPVDNTPPTLDTEVVVASSKFNNPVDVGIGPRDGSNLIKGIFVTDAGTDKISFWNISGSALRYGNQTNITNGSVNFVTGDSQNNSNTSDGLTGINTNIYDPYGVFVSQNTLYFGDYNMRRVRSLDLSISAGTVSSLVGYGFDKSGTAPSADTAAQEVMMSNPLDLAFMKVDSNNKFLYYTDTGNSKIVSVDMIKGQANYFVGGGATYNDNYIRGGVTVAPYGITSSYAVPNLFSSMGKAIFFSQGVNTSAGNNEPCMTNMVGMNSSSTFSMFGISAAFDYVRVLAGSYSQGCTTAQWNPAPPTGDPRAFSLQSINSANTERSIAFAKDTSGNAIIYYSIYEKNCIVRQKSDGTLETAVGVCDSTVTSGNATNNAISNSSAQLYQPRGIFTDPANPTNLFVVDQSWSATNSARVKYINFGTTNVTVVSDTVSPIVVGNGKIQDVFVLSTGTNARTNRVVASDTHICYSSGQLGSGNGYHNVYCYTRSSLNAGFPILRCGDPDGGSVGTGNILGPSAAVGGWPCTKVNLAGPNGLALDDEGFLYIVERDNHVIRKVKLP